jgi:effector-binding domain-containing protein
MYSQYIVSGYNITTDPGFQNEKAGNTEDLIKQFKKLYFESQNKKNKKIITKLTALILKYPASPQLKNFLSVAHNVQGNYKKATEVNNWILTEHPDYLFAKLNVANDYITDGQAQKVPEVLGEAMEIKELYPGRDLFHLAEVTGFYKVAIRYYAAIKNLELAENRLEVLNEIAPGHPDAVSAETFLLALRLEKGMERWKEDKAARIKVTSIRPVPLSKQKTPPVFNHAEINNLYQYGLRIPAEKLKEIIALPRETVIADLEKILLDAIDRYQYFKDLGYEEETHNFPLHAICLLSELKSENSLPAVLDFLENNEEVLEFWLGDHRTSTLWLPLYLLSQNSLVILKQFLIKPGICTYSKTAGSEALCQMVLYQPEKRNEIITIYKEVLSYFSHADLEDKVIDSDFLGLTIGDIIDCALIELLPVIKELFDKKYVGLEINGPYEEVEQYLKNPKSWDYKKSIDNIFELYEDILITWAGYSEDEDDYEEDEIQEPAVSVKPGRNDPCPCGSGKKYKKCCKDKFPI